MFENFRNFIRQGKQARGTGPAHATYSSPLLNTHTDSVEPPTAATPSNQQGPEARKDAYDVAVKQIVAEEAEQKSKMPRYPGLDRYKLLERMGDGAFSTVYKAYDNVARIYVAVKVVQKQQLNNSQRSTILKEVAIMRQLRHKNIVELIDFSETPDHYFIVLELIPGGELFHQIVRLTYFSEDLARHVIVQVAEAVRYLHEEAGVVHRDIKPENLLFYPCDFTPSKKKTVRKGEDESKEDEGEFIPGVGAGGIGVIKLADFGLSKIIWDSKTMTPCGTVGYTAPEIVKDERYSKSVDMWALGCVLYTILCGFPPFYDESIEILTEKVAKGQYTFLSPWWDDINSSAKDLISHLLTVDPDSRYTIEQFLQHPWITQKAGAPAPGRVPVAGTLPLASVSELHEVEQRAENSKDNSKDYASPVVVSLKEVFDVSNAVHRIEEETRRRGRIMTQEVVEEEDETSMSESVPSHRTDFDYAMADAPPPRFDSTLEHKMERVSVSKNSDLPSGRASRKPRTGGHHLHGLGGTGALASPGPFELHLEGATLLERRKRRPDVGPPITPQLVT